RAIWIDALCINQGDLSEKSKQIPIMRCIYENAEQVIIWLGLEDQCIRKALTLIQMFNKAFHLGLDSLYTLFLPPWFTKVWIIQEVVAARYAIM
ncbi:heterokaryon incompatibility, partial [Bisporella sp. PMI_857]